MSLRAEAAEGGAADWGSLHVEDVVTGVVGLGWTKDSRIAVWLWRARHMYMRRHAIEKTISSRCHWSCGIGRPRRRLHAISGPNFSTHRRMVSLLISNPRSASKSSTSR